MTVNLEWGTDVLTYPVRTSLRNAFDSLGPVTIRRKSAGKMSVTLEDRSLSELFEISKILRDGGVTR